MSNQDSISDTLAGELCETAYRIGLSGFKPPEMEKEILVEDIYYFYHYLIDNIPGNTSYLDALNIFIKEGKLDQAYRDWYEFDKQFIN